MWFWDIFLHSYAAMSKMLLISFDCVKLQGDCDLEDLPLGFLYDLCFLCSSFVRGTYNLSLSATAGRSLRGCLSSKLGGGLGLGTPCQVQVPKLGRSVGLFSQLHMKGPRCRFGDPVGSFLGQVLPLFLAVWYGAQTPVRPTASCVERKAVTNTADQAQKGGWNSNQSGVE